jgi:hypothetical protein
MPQPDLMVCRDPLEHARCLVLLQACEVDHHWHTTCETDREREVAESLAMAGAVVERLRTELAHIRGIVAAGAPG